MRKRSAWIIALSFMLATIGVLPAAALETSDQLAESVETVERIPAATEGLERSRITDGDAQDARSFAPRAPSEALEEDIRSRMSPRLSTQGFEVRPGLHSYYEGETSDRVSTDVGHLYPDVAPATDLVSQGLSDDRARHLLILNDSQAATEHRFRIEFDYGPVELELSEEGGVSVLLQETREDHTIVDREQIPDAPDPRDEPVELAYIEAPWAYDANGNEVPTSYRIEDNTVVQTVDHLAVENYPVVADPTYACGLTTCTMWFNRNETNLVASYGAAATAVVCSPFGGVAFTVCGVLGALYQGTATYHYNRGGCVYLRHYPWAPPPASTPWAGGHYGGMCS